MATLVEEVRHKLANTRKERAEFAAKFDADNMPTEDDERKLEAMINGEADLEAELSRVTKFENAKAGKAPSSDAGPNIAQRGDSGRKLITLGDQFTTSPEFLEGLKAAAPSGKIPASGGFKMGGVQMDGLLDFAMRAALVTGDSSVSAGAFVVADRFNELVTLGRKPLTIFDLIRRLTTSSDLVEYVAQTSRTNAADTRPEATGADDGTGAAAESSMAFVVRNAPVYDIATWIPATKQAVADVPQLRGIIDQELRDNVFEALADKIINADGSSDITGITQTSNTQTQAWDTNILTTTRKAKTKVWTVGRRRPNGYVLNPSDWETIDLLQDNEARYYYGGPSQVGAPRLWGLPVAEAEQIAVGAALVGDFTRCILWDRQQATVSVSDSHADFFIRGLLAILANLRAAFALTQPTAIVEIDVSA